MLKPPGCAWWLAVVAAADGFWGVGKGGLRECGVKDFEKQYENRYTDCSLELISRGLQELVGVYLRQ